MSDDGIRTHLVTKFVCAQCGHSLKLSYETPKPERVNGITPYEPEPGAGITGAAKRENTIAIYPCGNCYEKALAPIKKLKEVLGSL
jgi:transcription elongation factor Elf1